MREVIARSHVDLKGRGSYLENITIANGADRRRGLGAAPGTGNWRTNGLIQDGDINAHREFAINTQIALYSPTCLSNTHGVDLVINYLVPDISAKSGSSSQQHIIGRRICVAAARAHVVGECTHAYTTYMCWGCFKAHDSQEL